MGHGCSTSRDGGCRPLVRRVAVAQRHLHVARPQVLEELVAAVHIAAQRDEGDGVGGDASVNVLERAVTKGRRSERGLEFGC